MARKIFVLLFLLAGVNVYAQKELYSLTITDIALSEIKDSTIHISGIIMNKSEDKITFENPDLFSDIYFKASKLWSISIEKGNVEYYPNNYFLYVNKPIDKATIKLKPDNSYSFCIILDVSVLVPYVPCDFNSVKSNKDWSGKYNVQLKLKLTKPDDVEIKSNVAELIL